MPGGFASHGEILENGFALPDAVIAKLPAQQLLRTGLMELGAELEFAGHAVVDAQPRESATIVLSTDGPARDRPGKGRDVILRVTAVHAERMQLEDFAGQVL